MACPEVHTPDQARRVCYWGHHARSVQSETGIVPTYGLLWRMAKLIHGAASQARVLVAAHLAHINDLAHQLIQSAAPTTGHRLIAERIIRIAAEATDVIEAGSAGDVARNSESVWLGLEEAHDVVFIDDDHAMPNG